MAITLPNFEADGLPLVDDAAEAKATSGRTAFGQLRMEVIQDIEAVPSNVIVAWKQMTDNPMANPQWLLTWWKHYGSSSDQLQLVMFFDDKELVSIAPLYLDNGSDFKLLGSGKVCSDHSELLIGDTDSVERAAPLLLDWLLGDESPAWRCLHLEAIDSFSQTAQITKSWNERLSVWNGAGESICSIDLPEDWEQYLKSLSKNHRKRVRRWTRQHLDSEQVEVRSTASGWNMEEAYECLIRLHNLRRSELPEKGAFECERFQSFHREAFVGLAEQDRAEISAIFVDDRPVAVEYELCNDETSFAYQSGVDTSSELSSPGSVSVLTRLQSAVVSGKNTFDLMRGNEDYKSHWKAHCVPTRNIKVWPQNLSGNSSRLKFHAKRQLRSVARFVKARLEGESK